jgi:CheY-like chemotaxis protein
MDRVLLIEPDKILAAAAVHFLRQRGYRPEPHSDLQQAVMAADKHRPAAVITELQLAGRSGIELLYEFRSYPDWQNLPIIIYTSLQPAQLEPFLPALAEQNITVIHKSQVGLSELAQVLEQVLQPAKA